MSQRLGYFEQAPELTKKLLNFSETVKHGSLGTTLLDLVNIRASQLNGCGFCLDMHCKEAKIHGEHELRLYHVPIWRESTLFSEKERAALEWTEAVTKLSVHGVSDEVYERVRAQFSEAEIAELTFAVGIINMWNRLNISFTTVPGSADEMLGLTKAGLNYSTQSA
ncbi:MAG TPA: carboxymuconolactone decarboxylase family protein [Pyrinomonadaceae bacterium]|jgi:AhpD family alkylhydroperoxidase|nr:carboxymuconolactone decarboxylase family protein [Pyrinomonadaceae bacterium]